MNSVTAYRRATTVGLVIACIVASSVEAQSLPSSAQSRPVVTRSKNGVGIEVSRTETADQVAIDTGASQPKYEIVRLSNPPRLVVDLVSQKVTSSKNVAIADLDLVSGIRIGAHPTAGRVVMDLAQGEEISHSVRVDSGKIVVTLSNKASVVPTNHGGNARVEPLVEPRLPDATDSNQSDRELGASPKIENAVVPASLGDVAKSAAPSKEGAPKVHQAKQVPSSIDTTLSIVPAALRADAKVTIRGVNLNSSEGTSGAVAIDVDGKPEFSIERTAPSEYVLTLKNTSANDKVLSATLFSESQTASIRSVRSVVNGKDTQVRIFVQPKVYLTARLSGDKVVVEETSDLKKVVDDMRAQLAPQDGKKADDKKDQKAQSAAGKNPTAAAKGAADEMTDVELAALRGDAARYHGKLISLDLQDTDIDNALRIIAEVSDLNIVASEDVVGKVTLRLTDVPWDQALDVILKTHGLDKVQEGNVLRIAPSDKLRVERESLKDKKDIEIELAPLNVKYVRVSYAKAAELKSLVETVLSERGSVAYDERSNQLIVKDIQSGLDNVTELVAKVDLRTPQVLLETQIVEATRSLVRELGSELGFQYIQSPATGNGTGLNFPSAISAGGSVVQNGAVPNITTSSFPAKVAAAGGSAISMLFDSADGTKTLEFRLSQLETEGRVRIVSRPAVATTNNKAAEIKSVEKYRVKIPNGGTSVATGQGSVANGTGGTATEVIEAGIVLNVTPQASPDYFILLDIKAKSSSFGKLTVDGIPNEFERSASSSVLVSSGQTFALGGIYRLSESDDVAGMPFFKDIPVLGTFFRRLATNNSDEELLFFITPRIVEGSFDDSKIKAAS